MACPKESKPPKPRRVEGAGERGEAQRLHQEHRVHHERGHDQDREQHDEPVAVVARLPDRVLRGAGFLLARGLCHRLGAGRRALAGGSMRTIAMITKITVFEASG
jgi:hypothetical protein